MPNFGRPVSIRRNISSSHDPYASVPSNHKHTKCSDCGALFHSGRWHAPNPTTAKAPNGKSRIPVPAPVICPACHRIRDDVPAGVVHLSGSFVRDHADEIMRLIANESARATNMNPLHRVMHVAPTGDGTVEVHTTDEKLAQRIGKALHRAYSGEVKYSFVDGEKLARVNWQRGD